MRATCTNTIGSYLCSCKEGYGGDGRTCTVSAPECQTYQNLTSPTRNALWAFTFSNVQCDSSLSGWYRFIKRAGTKMATACVPKNRCNTHATGWLNGCHPTVADGQVTRQACFHWSSNCCNWSTYIQVRNCGEYFVYLLRGIPVACSLRYCGTA